MLIAPTPSDKVPILVSYHYMRAWTDEQIDFQLSNPHLEILLDSGGFSALNAGAEISMDDYIAFLQRWGDRLFGYMLLDKMGDPAQSARNYERMLDAGLHPIPIHVRGDDEARMNYLFERSAYVALGGLRRPKRGWSSKAYVALKMRWAAGRPVHWLGYTRQDMVPIYRPYSCDSANNQSAVMFGTLSLFDRGRIKTCTYHDIEKMSGPSIALSRALDRIGASWADLRDRRSWVRAGVTGKKNSIEMLSNAISKLSYVQLARWSLEQFGTRVFLAVTTSDMVNQIARFANETSTTMEPYELPEHILNIRSIAQWSTAVE